MKKLLAMLLVLSMASMANAAVIEIVSVGTGSLGHTGVGADKLIAGEILPIKIVLNSNRYYTYVYPNYDGYMLSSLNTGLTVTGGGSLGIQMNFKGNIQDIDVDGTVGFGTWDAVMTMVNDDSWTGSPARAQRVDDPFDGGNLTIADVDGDITQLTGTLNSPGLQGLADVVWDIFVIADGTGDIVLDLVKFGPQEYASFKAGPGDSSWTTLTDADMGGLTITAVPEPFTMSLLGLGGLALIRRRKKA